MHLKDTKNFAFNSVVCVDKVIASPERGRCRLERPVQELPVEGAARCAALRELAAFERSNPYQGHRCFHSVRSRHKFPQHGASTRTQIGVKGGKHAPRYIVILILHGLLVLRRHPQRR